MTINSNKLKAMLDAHSRAALAVFVASGYGGIGLVADAAQGDIDSVFTTVTGFDTALLSEPRGVTQDFANDGIRINAQGIWMGNVLTTFSHDEVNAGRIMQLRLFNDTTASAIGSPIAVGTGRNVNVTSIVIPGLFFDVPEVVEGDLLVLQVNSPLDTYITVDCISANFTAAHISEAQGF